MKGYYYINEYRWRVDQIDEYEMRIMNMNAKREDWLRG